MPVTYPFTQEDAEKAYQEWGANCGPNALAFALRVPLETVRPYSIHLGFDQKKYTNPTMMKELLKAFQIDVISQPLDRVGVMFNHERKSLVRIQWHGPWMDEGANPKWRYRQTHWICTFKDEGRPCVFDCNGGIMPFERWNDEIVRVLTKEIPRANGVWSPTHIWMINTKY